MVINLDRIDESDSYKHLFLKSKENEPFESSKSKATNDKNVANTIKDADSICKSDAMIKIL